MKKNILFVCAIILIISCALFEVDSTSYIMEICNNSTDSLKVIIRGIGIYGDTINCNEILTPKNVDFHGRYHMFSSAGIDEYPAPYYSQIDFDTMIDSFALFLRDNDSWIEQDVPSFWIIDNWSMRKAYDMSDCFLYHTFIITDSLLNLEE